MTFSVGQTVTWRSQANNDWKSKTGVIVAVVKAGEHAVFGRDLPTHRWTIAFRGEPRKQLSYLVVVDTPSKRGRKPKLYWPHPNTLVLSDI